MKRLFYLFLVLLCPLATVGAQTIQVKGEDSDLPPEGTPVITLTVHPDTKYPISFMTGEEETTVWIETKKGTTKHTVESMGSPAEFVLSTSGSEIKIYGDIRHFYVEDQLDQLIGIDASNHNLISEIDCRNSQVTFLKVDNCPELETLYLEENLLETLDITTCPLLSHLTCQKNKIEVLDVTNNTALAFVDCSENKIQKLDFSKCEKLGEVLANKNDLSELLLPESENLKKVEACKNKILAINVTGCPELEELRISDNLLTSLDVTKSFKLTVLWFDSNDISKIDLSQQMLLETLHCEEQKNGLSELDLTGSPHLELLFAYGNGTTKMDISKCERLLRLECYENKLKSLDLTNSVELVEIWCQNNELTELNVSQNADVHKLGCYDNQLTALDLSAMSNLERLEAKDNKLASVVLPESELANYIDVRNNNLEVKALNDMFIPLNDKYNEYFPVFKDLFIEGNPGVEACNVKEAFDKHWRVDGKTEYTPTACAEIAAETVQMTIAEGKLLVTIAAGTSEVTVYDLMGTVHYSGSVACGEQATIALNSGVYVVQCGSQLNKILIP